MDGTESALATQCSLRILIRIPLPRLFLLVGSHPLGFGFHRRRQWLRIKFLVSQLSLQRRQLRLNILRCLTFANYFLAVPSQEIIDSFDSNSDRPGGLVLVEIFEAEIGRAGLLDDAFDDPIDWSIMPAFEAGNLKSHQVRMSRREFRRPYLVVGAARIRVLPGVRNIQRTYDDAGAYFFTKSRSSKSSSSGKVFCEKMG